MELIKGKKFPNKIDQERIKLETRWERMLLSEEIYQKRVSIINTKPSLVPVDPLVPIADLVCEINADLLFGTFPEIKSDSVKTQDALNEYIKNNYNLHTDFIEGATYCSAMGTVFLYVFMYGDKIFHEFLKSSRVLWSEDMLGLTEFLYIKNIEINTSKKIYKIQRHYFQWVASADIVSPLLDPGRKHYIQELEITVNKMDEITAIKVIDDIATGFDFLPVYKIVNFGQLGQATGKSDLKGKEQLLAEIDARIDQINFALQDNQDPWIGLPPGIIDKNGRFNRANGKMFEKQNGSGADNTIDVISWDPQLEGAFKQIETMIYMVLFTSRISAPIAGLDKGGQVESGRALKYKSINTLTALSRRRLYWTPALKWYFVTIGKMGHDEFKNISPSDIWIDWPDGLPLAPEEAVDSIMQQVAVGLLSKKTALMEIHGYSDEKAQEELLRINTESKDKAEIDSTRFRMTL